jgi:hypothetical protein
MNIFPIHHILHTLHPLFRGGDILGGDIPLTGEALKFVHCEQCETEYTYRLKRTATCLDELAQKLEQGVALVPCPACGWYQKNMIPGARRAHKRWMLNTGACLTIGLIPFYLCAFASPIFLGCLLAFAIAGMGLVFAKFILSSHYDPNSQDLETRKKLGQSRAILRDELEKMIQAQQEGKA